MAKVSKSKELERINKLYENGKISESEFNKLRNEAMGYSNASCGGTIGGFLIICIIAYFLMSGNEKSSKTQKSETVSISKECKQVSRDKGYWETIVDKCGINSSLQPERFEAYADKLNCSFNSQREANALYTKGADAVIKGYNTTADKSAFCESQQSYLNKVIKKYQLM